MRKTTSTKGGARVPRRSGVAGLYVVPKVERLAVDPKAHGVLDADTNRIFEDAVIAAMKAFHDGRLWWSLKRRLRIQNIAASD
ncbi:MAG: hypothetical protein ACREQT_02450 [Candidatus Binataceae bacterium]